MVYGNYSKIVKFKDNTGKWNAYVARFENGFMVKEDYENIQKIIKGERIETQS